MKELKADLHVHTCLSPCAEAEMVPSAIVRQAKAVGLDMIAICDHNSTENVQAVIRAGERESVRVIPGIEITSREEVHILGLFKSERELTSIAAVVSDHLVGQNDEEAFGPQTIVDEWDQPVGSNPNLLIGATSLDVGSTVEAIHDCGGLAIAAHVDRQRFSLIGQLGFIPEGLNLDAVEVSGGTGTGQWQGLPVVASSDAHRLEDIGRNHTTFCAETASLEEIGKALRGEAGRRISVMEDLSLHILDIMENSVAASASRIEITIAEDTLGDLLSLEISDNGKGMDAEARSKALDPFFTTRTTRRVGLGLPLLAQAARQSGGTFELISEPGRGTTVKAAFQLSHPDMKPLGDIAETLRTILVSRPELDLRFRYTQDSKLIAGFGDPRRHDEESEND